MHYCRLWAHSAKWIYVNRRTELASKNFCRHGPYVRHYCKWGRYLCRTYIENFLTNQLVKEFWKSVHICQSYYQTSVGLLCWNTHRVETFLTTNDVEYLRYGTVFETRIDNSDDEWCSFIKWYTLYGVVWRCGSWRCFQYLKWRHSRHQQSQLSLINTWL